MASEAQIKAPVVDETIARLIDQGEEIGVQVCAYLDGKQVVDSWGGIANVETGQEVTGDTTHQPISTGGATFARSMDNIVAFGALLPGAPDTEHQSNESAAIADLKVGIEVYIRAFELLACEE